MLENILKDLNYQQLNAVLAPDGPTLVVAGAGSGKTRVLVARVLYLILERRVPPNQIICITFSTQAASAMKSRIESLIGDKAIFAGTFHSFCLRFLRRYSSKLEYDSNFSVLDEEDSKQLLKSVCKQLGGIYQKNFSLISQEIDFKKNEGLTVNDEKDDLIQTPWREYQNILKKSNLMDFGDLLVNTKIVLKEFPEVRNYVQNQISHILVDEVQDTNFVQYELLKLLGSSKKNIFLVGDEDQSIYSFRGARYQNIQDFCSDFNVSQIFKLEQNYRSSQEILQVANSIIINNKSRHEKNLFSEISTGVKPVYRSFYSDVDEASFIASNVQSLVSQGLETAIFYRTNALARALEEKFVEQKIPYRIVGGVRFMERKEIKDCVAWLRFQRNNNDSVAFSRIIGNLNMGIGRVTLDKILLESQNSDCLTALSKFRSDVAELLKRIWQVGGNKPYTLLKTAIEETKYIDYLVEKLGKERLDTLLEFLGFAKRFEDEGKNIDEFLDHISLVAEPLRENEQEDQTIKKPVLMTLHLSKGLEFDAVFICGFEDGLIPHALCRREHEIEEERRLLYVGVTRARKLLFLTSAYSRASYFGFGREVSRFFWEIPAQFIDVDSAPVSPAALSIEESSATNRNELLEGNRVNHYLYGAGRVIKILDSGRALVEFDAPKDLKFVNLSELLLTE